MEWVVKVYIKKRRPDECALKMVHFSMYEHQKLTANEYCNRYWACRVYKFIYDRRLKFEIVQLKVPN